MTSLKAVKESDVWMPKSPEGILSQQKFPEMYSSMTFRALFQLHFCLQPLAYPVHAGSINFPMTAGKKKGCTSVVMAGALE